jgi:hypothetical protein
MRLPARESVRSVSRKNTVACLLANAFGAVADCGLSLSLSLSLSLCPKQSPWKLLAQFSLSRERDVANIIG